MTLCELASIYCSLNAVVAVTASSYQSTARVLGDPLIDEITEKLLLAERQRLPSPTSWNIALGRLRTLLKFAVQRGWASEDHPVFLVKRRGVSVQTRAEITESIRDDVLAYLSKPSTPKVLRPSWFWMAVFDMLYYSGIRRRQLCHLIWKDFNLTDGLLSLRATGSKNKRECVLPIHSKLVETLKRYREECEAVYQIDEGLQCFHANAARGKGKDKIMELKPSDVSNFFALLSRELGIHLNAHLLRHSFATKVARVVPNIKTVQLLLNHDRTETTLRYIHPTRKDMRDLMNLPLVRNPKSPKEK